MRIPLKIGSPSLHPEAWVAPTAILSGAVHVERRASVWFGAVLRADGDEITIGEGANVQDGAIIHADPGLPVSVMPDVTIGHGAVLHGCSVGEGALIGMRATVLNGSTVGAQSLVAAGALVLEGSTFAPRSLIAGVPAKVRRELTNEECDALAANAAQYRGLAEQYRTAVNP